jgi:putative transposase
MASDKLIKGEFYIRLIKKEFLSTKKQLWKEYFWSRSYCLITTGSAPIEVIKKYIENQGMK